MVGKIGVYWIETSRIFCIRSENSTSRAMARIWGLNNIWQKALKQDPAYVLEVISERFDRLPQHKQDEILIHELAHVPRNFSGALLPHSRRRGSFHDKLKIMLAAYKKL
ncbi:hypothetical protein A2630_00190 [Candidatus Woesebacteria bacterium RIFCSPHIGHO2_01_FULL_44_10]|uniref:Putative phage metallopeptidase domain-containing protein n=1 Tax=Candidatus Woesebacteria bacterium RIFCSPLOWO2_01_FULL_44_14 TaxID=1802525 RepID=A0A1F8BXE9_9BACT|nr:MAG: hypothetical protein A2630_00190 [Candidatus Woesebacteria bacterium RIFCSPHIGHO2_01_FULL_44_10]OGM68722.1 MAG: hypothetical protein A2975_05490 [Candidatus Woesebacteria bacterium RIFCSPLOWO2_01_FULL_44_14]